MTKRKGRKKRTVKAWGVLLEGKPAHYIDGEDCKEITVYRTKKKAIEDIGNHKDYKFVRVTLTWKE